jgi:hypothetical protein
MTKGRVTPRRAAVPRAQPRPGRVHSSFLTVFQLVARLARAGLGLEPGHLRDAGDGRLGGRGVREAETGFLRPRGMPVPAGDGQGVQRGPAGVLGQRGQGR